MNLTKKNHYNPCFWTAFWNNEYLLGKRKGCNDLSKPRDVQIYSLNLKSNKIVQLKTENVFFEKGAGLAELTKENILDYCQRAFPDQHQGLSKYYEQNPEDLILDFENHFTEIENSYRPILEKVIVNSKIEDITDKTFLSFFVFFQIIRNHNELKFASQFFQRKNMAKFEMLLELKHTISDPKILLKLILPYLSSKWILYKLKENKFPLSDNPVLIRPLHILLPLAPDLLLEIDLKKTVNENSICVTHKGISYFKYKELKKRTIENSSREIVYGDSGILLKIMKSNNYNRHLQNIKTLANTQ